MFRVKIAEDAREANSAVRERFDAAEVVELESREEAKRLARELSEAGERGVHVGAPDVADEEANAHLRPDPVS